MMKGGIMDKHVSYMTLIGMHEMHSTTYMYIRVCMCVCECVCGREFCVTFSGSQHLV